MQIEHAPCLAGGRRFPILLQSFDQTGSGDQKMDFRFQVNLGGIIDLLSNHTYSSPDVYIRELLQNGVDAIVARNYLEPEHRGEIKIELSSQDSEASSFLLFRDNGIGLTEDEIHLFLATIGETSKRDGWSLQPTDFLGQLELAC